MELLFRVDFVIENKSNHMSTSVSNHEYDNDNRK